MRIIPLTAPFLDAFFNYCRTYGRSMDESFLSDEDLTPEILTSAVPEPAFLSINDEGQIIGAASLILRGYQEEGTGRFRVFHVTGHSYEGYQQLLNALLPHCTHLKSLFLFVPEDHIKAREALDTVGFRISRYSWLLTRPPREIPDPVFPPGFSVRPFEWAQDVQTWCSIRNTAFAVLKGQGTLTPDRLAQFLETTPHWEDSLLLLLDGKKPVGTIMVTEDPFSPDGPCAEIGGFAILPEYQGRGLGRQFLRYALQKAAQHAILAACLSVNAENEKATALYLQEGFQKSQSMVCYQYTLPQP